jgi:hypothetical protein
MTPGQPGRRPGCPGVTRFKRIQGEVGDETLRPPGSRRESGLFMSLAAKDGQERLLAFPAPSPSVSVGQHRSFPAKWRGRPPE